MFKLPAKQANLYAFVIFILTIVFSYYLPQHSITYTGFFLVIFLSIFVKGSKPTYIAVILSSIVTLMFLLFHPGIPKDAINISKHIFTLFLIGFIGILVLHVKQLYSFMERDKSHMTSLFQNATEGILLTDKEAKIILANPSASRMFGYTEEDLIGKTVEQLLPKRYRTGHVQLRDGFYQHPSNREMGSGRDLFGQKKDGSQFPVEVSLSSYQQNDDQFVIAFIVDITHRKEIEQSMLAQQHQLEKVTNDIRKLNAELEAKVEERTIILKEALQRLEQSQAELSEALDKERQLNDIKSRFVSMASHEFRTPLSSVLSSASLLSKYTTGDQQPNRDKHINRIKESVKHLNDLLEDFLSLGKLDEGKIGAQTGEFNLPDNIYDTIDEVRGLVKPGQEIQYNHSGDVIVFTDKKLLKNILINLISNALKFSNNDTTVEVESSVSDGKATITVEDKGIGISDEDQQHLFSSFFRGKNALNIQGTGLGLHIVKRYADLIGGRLNLTSKLGHGTTVSVTLPVNEHNHE
jgi:PAS domain S-box-containing protein